MVARNIVRVCSAITDGFHRWMHQPQTTKCIRQLDVASPVAKVGMLLRYASMLYRAVQDRLAGPLDYALLRLRLNEGKAELAMLNASTDLPTVKGSGHALPIVRYKVHALSLPISNDRCLHVASVKRVCNVTHKL